MKNELKFKKVRKGFYETAHELPGEYVIYKFDKNRWAVCQHQWYKMNKNYEGSGKVLNMVTFKYCKNFKQAKQIANHNAELQIMSKTRNNGVMKI